MIHTTHYSSPIGGLLLAEQDGALVGLWMDGQKYFLGSVQGETEECDASPVLNQAKRWLDRYFHGEQPPIGELPLSPSGSAFRREVWKILCEIPYGRTMTYGEISKKIAERLGLHRMSAQAVGGAVGHNPISIIIPCHRVVGTNGSLTGYAGGIARKIKLLEHEGVNLSRLSVPKKGTALGEREETRSMEWRDGKQRCFWANPKNPNYLRYHDEEWGVPVHDDGKLFEMLVLESFQAGLSWECVLNKQSAFREAFDYFDLEKVCAYDEMKLEQLAQNPGIIRNRLKLRAAVNNARIFREIRQEWASFSNYLWHWTGGKVVYETGKASSPLSDMVSKDLKNRGMKFVGTTIIYAYLQAVGVIYSHEPGCFLEHSPTQDR